MKVAFFSLVPNAGMYKNLVQEFINRKHDVCIIAPSYTGKSNREEVSQNLTWVHFRSLPMFNISIIRKGMANLIFPYLCLRSVKKYLKDDSFDLILMTTPPLGFYKAIQYLKKRNKKSFFYLILRDIHPEGAKFIGLHKYKPIYNYFRRIEKALYKMADCIGCMSPRNISFITERNAYLDIKKIKLLPNWITPDAYTEPLPEIKKKYGFDGKYIVVYGGNMGIPQGLDILLKLAELKKDKSDVLFLLVGDGTEKEKFRKNVLKNNLDNVRIMDKIPQEDYDELMKICDVGFISLHPKAVIPNIPSKTLHYYNSKLPILAAIDPITDYGAYMLDQANCGLWSLSSDLDALSSNFDILYHDKTLRLRMGENGFDFLKEKFTTKETYLEITTAYNANSNI